VSEKYATRLRGLIEEIGFGKGNGQLHVPFAVYAYLVTAIEISLFMGL